MMNFFDKAFKSQFKKILLRIITNFASICGAYDNKFGSQTWELQTPTSIKGGGHVGNLGSPVKIDFQKPRKKKAKVKRNGNSLFE